MRECVNVYTVNVQGTPTSFLYDIIFMLSDVTVIVTMLLDDGHANKAHLELQLKLEGCDVRHRHRHTHTHYFVEFKCL